MKSMKTSITILAVLCMLGATPAGAQGNFPNKPIRVVNPNTASSSQALFTRILMKSLEPNLGQTIVIDSRPGASSTIGVALVVKAEPDGHTLLVTTGTPLVGARAFLKEIPYDPINGVAGITIAYDSAFVLSVRMEEKDTTFAQLLEKMRKDPDKYSLGGVSQTMRVLNHIITTAAKLKHLYVPYTGFATQQSDLLGGRIGIMMQAPNLSINMARANQTIAIAVGGPRRLKPLPGTQTVSETLPGVELPYWLGFFAPAKTPKPILDRLYLAFAESFKLPEAIDYMENSGTILAMRPELIPDFMVKEEAKWLRLARAAGVEAE